MQTRPNLQRPVSIQVDGKMHLGCYYLNKDSITVHYGRKGSKPTLVGTMGVEACAQSLLLDLVSEV